MRETLYNQRFDDIYFSPEDGLSETRHVFLDGNGLPARWKGRNRFTIAETGFGTGLNFLAAWSAFEETASSGQQLDYLSFELYPLCVSEIKTALSVWQTDLGDKLSALLANYPLRIKGFHRLQLSARVRLTLVFDDINAALPTLTVPCGVDAWFLDGFAPSKNPEMWTETLYREMARLSAPGATASTFTVAGHVRRGLESAGFVVEKKPGFGRKKEMTSARLNTNVQQTKNKNKTNRIAIVGGGLAGTSCAYVLGQQGAETVVFEQADSLASGASGNMLGLYNPRFYAQRGPESDFYTSAYAQAYRAFSELSKTHDIRFNACGCLHLINSEDKEKRFRTLCENDAWHDDHVAYLSAARATEKAGIKLGKDALYLPQSGVVSPYELCHAYAKEADIRLNTPVRSVADGKVNGEGFDSVIIANAAATREFDILSWLPIHTVRGQVSNVAESGNCSQLQTSICYGGYLSPPVDGRHMLGSTFQKWRDDTGISDEDHQSNLDKLAENVPGIDIDGLDITDGRAALRTAAQDHFPVIGRVRDQSGVTVSNTYISTAHGSHGLISSLMGAHLIADMVLENPWCLSSKTANALDSERFLKRMQKKTMGK